MPDPVMDANFTKRMKHIDKNERYFIEEEGRMMERWEEYRYTELRHYFEDKRCYAWYNGEDFEMCHTCDQPIIQHDRDITVTPSGEIIHYLACHDIVLRSYFNKYTGFRVGWPVILNMYEINEGRKTQ